MTWYSVTLTYIVCTINLIVPVKKFNNKSRRINIIVGYIKKLFFLFRVELRNNFDIIDWPRKEIKEETKKLFFSSFFFLIILSISATHCTCLMFIEKYSFFYIYVRRGYRIIKCYTMFDCYYKVLSMSES